MKGLEKIEGVKQKKILTSFQIFHCPKKHYIIDPSDAIEGFYKVKEQKKSNQRIEFERIYYCHPCRQIYGRSELGKAYD